MEHRETPEPSPAGSASGRGVGSAYEIHPQRDAIIAEVHARPFRPVQTPRVVHNLAFESRSASADSEALIRFCKAHGASVPDESVRQLLIPLGDAELRWERHTEFVNMTLSVAAPSGDPFAPPNPASLAAFLPKPSGPLIVATRLALIEHAGVELDLSGFDPASLCLSEVESGAAVVATDFRLDTSGFTRLLVANRALSPTVAGALVQRLLEIETYRTLALLGLPEAQRISPFVDSIEAELLDLTNSIRAGAGLDLSRELLDRLVGLAAGVESEAGASSYRFAATRAYSEIVFQRLGAIREERIAGYDTMESFLARRMKPALRTCEAAERRIGELSQKLARTSNLLRTRVDIELESQNRDLLDSVNRRGRQQLRLQQTVEGLSVAAVSYYVVGLIGYLVKGGETVLGLPFDPAIATALAVPFAVLLVWLLVRRIRSGNDRD